MPEERVRAYVDEVLERCVEEEGGFFGTGTVMGQRFTRYINSHKKQKKKYKKLKGHRQAQSRFRMKYAQGLYKKLSKSRTFTETHEEQDFT